MEKLISLWPRVIDTARHFHRTATRNSNTRTRVQIFSLNYLLYWKIVIIIAERIYLALRRNLFYVHKTTGCGEINLFMRQSPSYAPPFCDKIDSHFKTPPSAAGYFSKIPPFSAKWISLFQRTLI